MIGDPVVGYVASEPDIAHIWDLYVATPRRGLGRALLDHVKQGRSYLQLNIDTLNLGGQAFFESQNFTFSDEYWLGWDGMEETRMEWRA